MRSLNAKIIQRHKFYLKIQDGCWRPSWIWGVDITFIPFVTEFNAIPLSYLIWGQGIQLWCYLGVESNISEHKTENSNFISTFIGQLFKKLLTWFSFGVTISPHHFHLASPVMLLYKCTYPGTGRVTCMAVCWHSTYMEPCRATCTYRTPGVVNQVRSQKYWHSEVWVGHLESSVANPR